MRWIDYRKKLGIGLNDEQKFEALKNNTILCFNDAYNSDCHEDFVNLEFVDYFFEVNENPSNCYFPNVIKSFSFSQSVPELISKLVAFSNTVAKYNVSKKTKQFVKKFVPSILNKLDIPFEIITDEDGTFIFPKGAKELDDALVSEPLEWLGNYPNAQKAWVSALKDYSKANGEDASDIADKFRKALETFFQEYFKTNKSLENLKSEYGDRLKEYGVPSEISSNFVSLLEAYTKYNNNYAKHHDKASSNVLEYIMYQTGNIIRLLIMLQKGYEAAE